MIPIYMFAGGEPFIVDYLVVAGGGGGGNEGGGGGAGGYITSVTGEQSGGPSTAVERLNLFGGTPLLVTVGAGGAAQANGGNSVFGSVVAIGGGRGHTNPSRQANLEAGSGGSGGGGGPIPAGLGPGGSGTADQGNDGGDMVTFGGNYPATYEFGGGGGAAEEGNIDGNSHGGDGLVSTITGASVTRGGGGAGANAYNTQPGGAGGGGAGASGDLRNDTGFPAVAGTVNTGGGGGGGYSFKPQQPGGSGIVVLRYSSTARIINQISPGLTYTYSDDGTYKRYVFTAGTGNITF